MAYTGKVLCNTPEMYPKVRIVYNLFHGNSMATLWSSEENPESSPWYHHSYIALLEIVCIRSVTGVLILRRVGNVLCGVGPIPNNDPAYNPIFTIVYVIIYAILEYTRRVYHSRTCTSGALFQCMSQHTSSLIVSICGGGWYPRLSPSQTEAARP